MTFAISVRYDGRDAARHRLDLRLLGRSLVGLDRSVHEVLFFAVEGRTPKQRERLPITVQAEAPVAACVEMNAVFGAVAGVLPFAYETLVTHGSDFIFQAFSYILKLLGGKPKEADPHFMEMVNLHREMMLAHIDESQKARAEIYENEAQWRAHSLELIDRLRPFAKEFVAPVGPSCDVVTLKAPAGRLWAPTVVDAAMADAVRSTEPLEVGEMQEFTVRVDGVIKHARTIKIDHPNEPGKFLTADVRDPSFDQPENVYFSAFTDDTLLVVDAKPTYRANGELVKLYVMDARPA